MVEAVRPRRKVVFLVVLALALCAVHPAASHSFAASAFDAVANGPEITVRFNLDRESVIETLPPRDPDAALTGEELIGRNSHLISEYVGRRFIVRGGAVGGAEPCPVRSAGSVRLDRPTDTVRLEVIYGCAREPDAVTLTASLFAEQAMVHHLMGTLRRGATEHSVLFSPGTTRVVIDLRGSKADADAPATGVAGFFRQGVLHILGGLDHLLFVIALMSVVASWTEVAKIVTSFTVAHSITLALGALDVVRLAPRIVEPLVALSILYVAIENVRKQRPRGRLAVTFGFGLVHGFAFSSVLRDLGLSRAHLLPALVGFNLGVEAGQLIVVAPLAPLVWWLQRRLPAYQRVRVIVNGCVALVALWWFIERVFLAR